MDIPMVGIPVRCPKCGLTGISEFPVVVVAIGLVKWNNMCLYAPCHEGGWDASENELEAIRHYLGREWLREHGQAFAEPRLTDSALIDDNDGDIRRKAPLSHVVGVLRGVPISMQWRAWFERDAN
jgi:hypothetical protein